MDAKKAKAIASGKLQVGNSSHIEAIKKIERKRQLEAWNGLDIKLEVYRNPKTGMKRTRMSLSKSGD